MKLGVLFIAMFAASFTAVAQHNQDVHAEIHKAVAAFQDAYNQGDADRIGDIFTEDARMIDFTGDVLEGREVIIKRYASEFKVMKGQLEITEQEILPLAEGHVVLSGGYSAKMSSKTGSENMTASGMYGTVLQKHGNDWKIKRHIVMRPVPAPGPSSVNQELDAFIDAYEKAQKSGSSSLCASMYDVDAKLILPDGTALDGRSSIKDYMTESHSKNNIDIEINYNDVVPVSNNQFLINGDYTMTTTSKMEGTEQTIKAQYTTLIKKNDGQWKIVRQLNMVPLART